MGETFRKADKRTYTEGLAAEVSTTLPECWFQGEGRVKGPSSLFSKPASMLII
jgi:hypothetical protein